MKRMHAYNLLYMCRLVGVCNEVRLLISQHINTLSFHVCVSVQEIRIFGWIATRDPVVNVAVVSQWVVDGDQPREKYNVEP
jgi:hypothetical protein